MYTFDFQVTETSIPFLCYGPGYYNPRVVCPEDPIDIFWRLLAGLPDTWYGHCVYRDKANAVKWLLKRQIYFTVEVVCKDDFTSHFLAELVTYRIKIPNNRDAILFRLSCPDA